MDLAKIVKSYYILEIECPKLNKMIETRILESLKDVSKLQVEEIFEVNYWFIVILDCKELQCDSLREPLIIQSTWTGNKIPIRGYQERSHGCERLACHVYQKWINIGKDVEKPGSLGMNLYIKIMLFKYHCSNCF